MLLQSYSYRETETKALDIQIKLHQHYIQYSGLLNLLADLLFKIIPYLKHAFPVGLGERVQKSVGVEGSDGDYCQEKVVVHLWFIMYYGFMV
jgi:hypothetical protein